MDIQALREELATIARDEAIELLAAARGWTFYSNLPGSLTPPAVVVKLPTEITFDGSLRFATVQLPVDLIVGPLFDKSAEAKLLTEVLTVANAFRNLPPGDNYRSCQVTGLDTFTAVSFGNGTEAYSATINLRLMVNI